MQFGCIQCVVFVVKVSIQNAVYAADQWSLVKLSQINSVVHHITNTMRSHLM